MYDTIAKVFLILIWMSQFYSVVGLVFWINRNLSPPRLNRKKIDRAMTVQIVILAAITLFFIVDYVRNRFIATPSFRFYLVNGVPYLIIPAIYLLVLWKIKKRFLSRA